MATVELNTDSKGRYIIAKEMIEKLVLGVGCEFCKPNVSAKRTRNSEVGGFEFDLGFDLEGTALSDLIFYATEDLREDTLTRLRCKHNPPDALDRRNGKVLAGWHEAKRVMLRFADVCRGRLAQGLGLDATEPDVEKLTAVASRLSPEELVALVSRLQAKMGEVTK